MSAITQFKNTTDQQRVFIFLDGQYATSVRRRTFDGLNLRVGQKITKDEIDLRESLYWKTKYSNNGGWERENKRLDRITQCLEFCDERFVVKKTGFGAGSTEFIAQHPELSGSPDLEVTDAEGNLITCVEVTGTERMRGNGFWVRPDKIKWARDNPNKPFWLALHYSEPKEMMFFHKPDPTKNYETTQVKIGADHERFIVLSREDMLSVKEFISVMRDVAGQHFKEAMDFTM